MMISSACFLILTFVAVASTLDFTLKGDPCSKFDSCYSKPKLRTCSCDNNCHIYGTCCHDIKKPQQGDSSDAFHCYHRRIVTPVFVKRSCSEDYLGHVGDKLACLEDDEDEMDVNNNLLVTSYKTKITYWNKHCAACSNEPKDELEFWNIEVFCPNHKEVNRNLIRKNLTYHQDKSQWGLEIGGEFLQCVVKYSPPPYIDEVKPCTPKIISSCPEDYKDEDVIVKCSAYYAERKLKSSDIYYKNPHCAICNNVDVKKLECSEMAKPEDNAEEMDFREMVEEVFTKGRWIQKNSGEIYECSKGYSYDPFRTKCRRDTALDDIVEVSNSSHSFKEKSLAFLAVLLICLVIIIK